MTDTEIKQIVTKVTENFRIFGGGKTSEWNPLVNWTSDQAPNFAAGVDVEEVVRFVLKARAALELAEGEKQ